MAFDFLGYLSGFLRAIAGLAPAAKQVKDVVDGNASDIDKAVVLSQVAGQVADAVDASKKK